MDYTLRSIQRTLSLVVAPMDGYTGLRVASAQLRVSLTEHAQTPLVKSEGFYVFYDLPVGAYTVQISGGGYLNETVTMSTGVEPVTVILRPNRRYTVTHGMTWVEGQMSPHTPFLGYPVGASGLTLLRLTDETVALYANFECDVSYACLAIGESWALLFLRERLDAHTYRLEKSLPEAYPKGVALHLVSRGRADENGYLFCPIRRFLPEHTAVSCLVGAETLEVTATFGCGNGVT